MAEPKNVCGRARRNSSLRGNVSRIQVWEIILFSKQEKQHFSVQRFSLLYTGSVKNSSSSATFRYLRVYENEIQVRMKMYIMINNKN